MGADMRALNGMTNRIEQISIRRGTFDDGVNLRARHAHLRRNAIQKRDAKRLHSSWREYFTKPAGGVESNVRPSNKDNHLTRYRAEHAVPSPGPSKNL